MERCKSLFRDVQSCSKSRSSHCHRPRDLWDPESFAANSPQTSPDSRACIVIYCDNCSAYHLPRKDDMAKDAWPIRRDSIDPIWFVCVEFCRCSRWLFWMQLVTRPRDQDIEAENGYVAFAGSHFLVPYWPYWHNNFFFNQIHRSLRSHGRMMLRSKRCSAWGSEENWLDERLQTLPDSFLPMPVSGDRNG